MLSLLGGVKYAGFLSRLIPAPRLYRRGVKRTVIRDGIRYELDPSCMMQWYVYWDFKEKQRERLYSLVGPGDVVLDVGTNIGETLLHFSRLVGPDGFVYGFEPDPVNFEAGMRNVEMNAVENVHIFSIGISDKQDSLRLFRVDPNNLGMNRILSETEAEGYQDFTTIDLDALDNIVHANEIDRVNVMKIDIEGYEMHALRGARDLLAKHRPRLFIEVGYTRLIQNGTSPTELVRLLEDNGYSVRHAETDENITSRYDFSPLGDGGIDVYAIHKDEGDRTQSR
jgi:FkbM family methyltransferase